jgi:hypothetical protein
MYTFTYAMNTALRPRINTYINACVRACVRACVHCDDLQGWIIGAITVKETKETEDLRKVLHIHKYVYIMRGYLDTCINCWRHLRKVLYTHVMCMYHACIYGYVCKLWTP